MTQIGKKNKHTKDIRGRYGDGDLGKGHICISTCICSSSSSSSTIYHLSFLFRLSFGDLPLAFNILYTHTHIFTHTHTHIFYLLFDRYLGYGDQDDLLRHLREHPESGGVGDFAVARRHDARLVWDLFYITADAGAGKFISLEVSNLGLWLFLYTAGFLFHVECCIG